MAVKDVYVPYDEWIKEVFLVEDRVIGQCLGPAFLSSTAQEMFGSRCLLKYPFELSYAQYCLSFQNDSHCDQAIKRGLGKISYDGQEAKSIKFGTANDESILDKFKAEYTDHNVIKYYDRDTDEFVAFVTAWDIYTAEPLPLVASEFTLSEYLKKRFNPFFCNTISSETYDDRKDEIVILNQDRNDCVIIPENTIDQVKFIGMPNFNAMAVGAGLTYKFGIKFSDELVEEGLPSWVPLGDVDKDEVEESIVKYSDLLHSGETTIYYGEFCEY